MMNDDETIIQRIQPQCDTLHLKMKDEKDAQHKTNRGIADSTGLPVSTVAKFFSGNLSNPGVFGVSAICIDLDMSLDELMGIAQAPPGAAQGAELDRLQLEIAHKDELLQAKDAEIGLLLEHSQLMDRGLQERDKHIAETRRIWKPIIYGLCVLCIMLASVMMVYIVLDAKRPDVGLIRGVENTSIIVWVGISAVIMFALLLAHMAISRWYRKTSKQKGND